MNIEAEHPGHRKGVKTEAQYIHRFRLTETTGCRNEERHIISGQRSHHIAQRPTEREKTESGHRPR